MVFGALLLDALPYIIEFGFIFGLIEDGRLT